MSPPIRPITGSQMAVFLINSRLGLLCVTPNSFKQESHFFRSYVRILPSSLTRGRSCALDYSSFLPVSVSGTVLISLALDSISWHPDYILFNSTFSPLVSQLTSCYGFAYNTHQLVTSTGITVTRQDFTSCVLPSKLIKVLDFEPDSHRLRLSSSP